MKVKPPTANPDPRMQLKRRILHPASWRPPFQLWIQAATPPNTSGEAQLPVTLQPTIPDAALEQLSSRIVQAVQTVPLSVDPHKLLVTFHSGWLQGVTCAVVVAGRRVRLSLKADGARQRADLLRSRKILAGRLGSAGFELSGYEVSP